jgi:hypothetical protein
MLPFNTTAGPLTLAAYLQQIQDASVDRRNCEANTFYVSAQQTSGAGETMLAEEMGWPVILATPIEQRVVAKYRDQHPTIKMKEMQPDDFFRKASEPSAKESEVMIRSLFEHQLHMMNIEHVTVRVKRFNKHFPALFLIESEDDSVLKDFFEQLERGARDQSDPKQAEILQHLTQRLRPTGAVGREVLYVNSDNPTIQNTLKLHMKKPASREVSLACRTVYNSAFLQSIHAALSVENARVLIANFNETISLVLALTLERIDEVPPPPPVEPVKPPPAEPAVVTRDCIVSGIGEVTSKDFVFLIHPFGVPEVDAALKKLKQQAEGIVPGLSLRSAEHEVQALTISKNVGDMICSCRFAIADLTGFNPNVMMEIGMVMSIGKPVLMIWSADDGQKLPVNIGDSLYCKYDILRGSTDKNKIGIEFSEDMAKHLGRAVILADEFRRNFKLSDGTAQPNPI